MGGWRSVNALVVSLWFCAAPANAETAAECKKRLGNEVNCFIMNAKSTHLLCSVTVQLALLDSKAVEKSRECITEVRTEMSGHYKAALARLSKNAPGAGLLKDTYATWQTSIGSLYPNSGEVRLQYNARMGVQQRDLDDKLNRLDLEVPEPRVSKAGAAEQKKMQDKMRSCSGDASAQGLRGDGRKEFMIQCLGG